MITNSIILFISAMVGGLLAWRLRHVPQQTFRLVLVFAASYLFATTVVHLLPELASGHNHADGTDGHQHRAWLFVYVLAGFFLQQFLELLSGGVEHGHLHAPHGDNHYHKPVVVLLVGLGLHAFMEGTILNHPSQGHQHDSLHADALLFGIVLHKLPAAFALMSVLVCQFKKGALPIVLLTVFALASPAGVILSELLEQNALLPEHVVEILFAIVAGNFLHISTTIFFESTPHEHKFNLHKTVISLIAASLAVLTESLSH